MHAPSRFLSVIIVGTLALCPVTAPAIGAQLPGIARDVAPGGGVLVARRDRGFWA